MLTDDQHGRTVTRTVTADGVVTREVDGEEQDMLRVPISSTRADREEDRFDRDALEDMADQIRTENPMVFDNHGIVGSWMEAIPYDSRETIGAQMDAEVEVDDDSNADLYALVNPDGTHPEGERMVRQVRDECQPLKFSIGFKVRGFDARADVDADYEGDGRVFTAVDLMETSRVGMPANPDASVTQSMTAKDSHSPAPGVVNHPMFQMLAAMQGDTPAGGVETRDAVDSDTVDEATPVHVDEQGKAATDGGTPTSDELAQLREDLGELRAEVAELREDGDDDEEDDGKGSCEVDTDFPEGEVCLEGECVPEDEVDDDERTPEDVPDHVAELRAQNRELRDEISEIRDAISDRGDPETTDTDMTDADPTRDVSDDKTDDSDDDNGLLFG